MSRCSLRIECRLGVWIFRRDLCAGATNMRRVKASLGNSALALSLAEAFQARARVAADRKVEELVSASKAIIRSRDKRRRKI